ncbi:MAG: hypothetical protein ABSE43_08320 [Steroidobacteraceae bacterium]
MNDVDFPSYAEGIDTVQMASECAAEAAPGGVPQTLTLRASILRVA